MIAILKQRLIQWKIKILTGIFRQGLEFFMKMTAGRPASSIVSQDHCIGKTRVRLYTNQPTAPLLIYAHGGGWVSGSLETHHVYCSYLAKTLNVTVASVDYSLAPEHPFPQALDDLYKVYQWFKSQPSYKNSLIFLGGDSAGGNLMTSLTLMLMKNKTICLPKGLILVCPALDLTLNSFKIHRTDLSQLSPFLQILGGSMRKIGQSFMKYFRSVYVQEFATTEEPFDEDLLKNPEISPFYQDNFSGFPPTLIITATLDPLYQENCLFVQKLRDHDCTVHQYVAPFMPHVFVLPRKLFPRQTHQALQWLKQYFSYIC